MSRLIFVFFIVFSSFSFASSDSSDGVMGYAIKLEDKTCIAVHDLSDILQTVAKIACPNDTISGKVTSEKVIYREVFPSFTSELVIGVIQISQNKKKKTLNIAIERKVSRWSPSSFKRPLLYGGALFLFNISSSIFHDHLILGHPTIDETPERGSMIFFLEVCEFMDDHRIDKFRMIFHIFSKSITKTESIVPTAASPSSFRNGYFYTLYFWEIFSFPEFLSSRNDVLRKFSFHLFDFFRTICFLFWSSSFSYLFLTFLDPVFSFSEKSFDEKFRIEEGRSHKNLSSW